MKLKSMVESLALIFVLWTSFHAIVLGQTVPPSISISDFRPRSMLKVKQTNLKQAKYPVIDLHTHFRQRTQGSREEVAQFIQVMNRNNISICISLDAVLGSEDEHLKFLGGEFENRFGVFVHIDFQGNGTKEKPETWACNQPIFVRTVVEQLREAKRRGCLGLKFFKQFGLEYRDAQGELIKIDDPKFDPIWQICGELEFPVLIHTADPAAFFEPIGPENERAEELLRHPEWSFFGPQFPSRSELLDARNRVISRHPNTVFIGAHVANQSEDLNLVGQWLDKYPNLNVDIASRIGELGRQPNTAKDLFARHSERILFGTDGPWPEQRLHYYWRFLETNDEYFPYSEKQPQPQGLWFIYGAQLDDELLRKIYFENCLRIVPALRKKYESNQLLLKTERKQ